jgi:hypothetical protein
VRALSRRGILGSSSVLPSGASLVPFACTPLVCWLLPLGRKLVYLGNNDYL